MKLIFSIIWLLTILNSHSIYCQDPNAEKDVYVVLEQFALAMNNRDVEKAASIFIDDDLFQYISKGFIVNKTEWKNYQEDSWQRMEQFSFKWSTLDIKVLSKNSAVASCVALKSFRLKSGLSRAEKNPYAISLEKASGNWLFNGIQESKFENSELK